MFVREGKVMLVRRKVARNALSLGRIERQRRREKEGDGKNSEGGIRRRGREREGQGRVGVAETRYHARISEERERTR